jgi:hypothetical protein
VTPDQRQRIEFLIDPESIDRNPVKLAIKSCLEERDAAIALARRVHAECGPRDHDMSYEYIVCKCCEEIAHKKTSKINHPPDCLWLAADALVAKNGEAKP